MSSYKNIAVAVASQFHEESSLTEVIASLDLLNQVLKKKNLGKLLQNSLINIEDRLSVLKKLITLFHLPVSVEELTIWLIQKKKIEEVSKINEALKDIRKKQYNTVEGEVVSVKSLSLQEKDTIKKVLEQITGNKVLLKASTNPDILGGVILKSGDRLFDASIATQLHNLTKMMNNE